MTPIKIVHFADVHLGMENYGKIDPQTGLNSRLGDFTKSFDEIVKYSIQNKIDLVAFAGDAYKTRDPSPTYQREFAQRIFQISSAGIPVVMVVGNHDFPNASGKADTLEIFPTLSVPNVHIFKKEGILTIQTKSGPIQVAGLPWFTRGQLLSKAEMVKMNLQDLNMTASQKLTEKINYLSARIDPKIPAILVAHAALEKAVYGSERQVMIGSEVVIPISAFHHSKFAAVLLGHLHKYQIIKDNASPPLIYSGSIERVDFGEEKETKGFVLTEIIFKNQRFLAQSKFMELPTRPFISIRKKISVFDKNPTEQIISEIKKRRLKSAVVKVIIEVPEEKSLEIRESAIREALKDADFIAGIIKEIQRGEKREINQGFSDEFLTLDTLGLLEKYLQSKKISRGRIGVLKKETQKLLEEETL
ncbi:MAG TPA: exonuclease SbcCD subunit D [Patescibacteria group bacterium]|nr:exonuclease SbcCD subunit D [Patescibacteria group bacterium]